MDLGALIVVAAVVGIVVVAPLVGGRSGGGPPHTGTDVRAAHRDDSPAGFGGG